ncbi:MAG: MlaD family protein [Flavisolibacter sp.]
MAQRKSNLLKLGLFVIAGMAVLIVLLYVIGKNQNLFGQTFSLKARFTNVHGLRSGNNIRYGGIDVGTVKTIRILNDTTIEAVLLIQSDARQFIHKNALLTISTDGLMGNKLVNIEPSNVKAPLVEEGDILYSVAAADTDQMLKVLSTTNQDVAAIASGLKQTVARLNAPNTLWTLLEDPSLPSEVRLSLNSIKQSTQHINKITMDLQQIVGEVRSGKGAVGSLLQDTTLVPELHDVVQNIKIISTKVDKISLQTSALIDDIQKQMSTGKGPLPALLNDEDMTRQLSQALRHINEASQSINQSMEALQHSFLLRGYFKKLEKQKTRL